MRLMIMLGLAVLALGSTKVMAGDEDDGSCPAGHCEVEKRTECFHLVCYYESKDDQGETKSCKAASDFYKEVTENGGEVQDDSTSENSPSLNVSCNNEPAFYSNSANRYTDLLGTRIQGQMGPHPAILLPRGALHSGANGQSGPHVTTSILEFDEGDLGGQAAKMSGQCKIWTGNP